MTATFEAVVAGQPRLLRAINEQALLNALRRRGPLTRADLVRISGLSKPTVGLALSILERDGLVHVAGRRSGVRGPAALLYGLVPEVGFVLSLDVGSEYVRGALGDLTGSLRSRGARGVHAASGRARMSGIVALAGELMAAAGVCKERISQTVVASPGVYDPRRDALTMARALPGWERPGVLAELRHAFGPSTLVQNDVNLAALAERDHGRGRASDSFVFVSVGTGVGMGLVLSGRLHTGWRGAAGEIGFLPITLEGSVDSRDARRRGLLEAGASAAGVVGCARRRGLSRRMSARGIFDAAAAGDERAKAVVADEAELVARAIAAVVAVVDPPLVVLGGGIGRAPGFAQAVAAALPHFLAVPPELSASALDDEAVVTGGMVAGIDLAWQRLVAGRGA